MQPNDQTAMDDEASAVAEGSYAAVNGLELYYEVHGARQPLILLHGAIGAIEMFGAVLPLLAAGRQVIAVDLRAHGRTADIQRPLSLEAIADDIAGLLRHLGIDRAVVPFLDAPMPHVA